MSDSDIGARIRRLRLKYAYRQAALASKIGVSPGTLSRWERGNQCPRQASRRKLEELLGPLDARIDFEDGLTQKEYDQLSPDEQDEYEFRISWSQFKRFTNLISSEEYDQHCEADQDAYFNFVHSDKLKKLSKKAMRQKGKYIVYARKTT